MLRASRRQKNAPAGSHAEAALHADPAATLFEHFASSELWFETFQNWQSEFLSTAVLVVLSIFLRHKGSPESKPVTDPDCKTGAE